MMCAPPPLVLPLLLSFAAGVLVLQWQPKLPSTASAVLAAAVALASAIGLYAGSRKAPSLRLLAAVPALAAAFAIGFAYAAARADLRLSDALPEEWEGEDIAVTGIVDDLPQVSERGARFAFAVERVVTRGAVVPSRLSLSWYATQRKDGSVDAVPALAGGERWQLVVRLKRPHGTVNPHGFDIEAWLLENGIRATGYVRNDDRNRRVDAFAGRAADFVLRARESIRSRIVAALPEAPYAGVIVALTIGEQRAIPEAQWRVFNRTGIAHLISISGLHVTVFATLAAGFAYGLARRSVALTSRIPARKVAALVGVAFATVYVLLAGSGVPAVRTLLMLAVASLGLGLARPGTAAAIWLWALVAVLAWDPWAGAAAGFWLSFGAVGALLYAGAAHGFSAPCRSVRGRRPSSRSRSFPERSRFSSRCRSFRRSPTPSRSRSSRSASYRSRSAPSSCRSTSSGRSPMPFLRRSCWRSTRSPRHRPPHGSSTRRRHGRSRSRSAASRCSWPRAASRAARWAPSPCCRSSSSSPRHPIRARSA
jgi:competence protein ComEC